MLYSFYDYVSYRDKQQIEESWGKALDGAISGVGRTPIQGVRGLYNTAYGLGQTGTGLVQTAAGLGKGALSGNWDLAKRGLKNTAMGPVNAISGVGQGLTAATGLSGLGRTYYAGRTPDNDGVTMSPNSQDTGKWGHFKNWMGWQGRPKETPGQDNSSQESPPAQNPSKPMKTSSSKRQLTPEQQAFFKKYPELNRNRRPSFSTTRTPESDGSSKWAIPYDEPSQKSDHEIQAWHDAGSDWQNKLRRQS